MSAFNPEYSRIIKQPTVYTTHSIPYSSAPVDLQLQAWGPWSAALRLGRSQIGLLWPLALTAWTSPGSPALPSCGSFQNHEIQTKTGPPLGRGICPVPRRKPDGLLLYCADMVKWAVLVTPGGPGQARGLSRWPHQGLTWLPGSPGRGGGGMKDAHRCGQLLPTWRELCEGPGNSLQGGEVVILGSVQSLVAADVTICKYLLAGRAHTAV